VTGGFTTTLAIAVMMALVVFWNAFGRGGFMLRLRCPACGRIGEHRDGCQWKAEP
jgi:hypothetical protein